MTDQTEQRRAKKFRRAMRRGIPDAIAELPAPAYAAAHTANERNDIDAVMIELFIAGLPGGGKSNVRSMLDAMGMDKQSRAVTAAALFSKLRHGIMDRDVRRIEECAARAAHYCDRVDADAFRSAAMLAVGTGSVDDDVSAWQ